MTLTTTAATLRGLRCTLLTAVTFALLFAPMAAPASAAARGSAAQTFTLGTPGVPFGFVEPLDPLFTLGDEADQQLAFVTPLTSVPVKDVMAKTPWMTLGAPGVDKEFRRFVWTADSDPGASYQVSYSISGGLWVVAPGDGGYTFPEGSHGKTIAVRVKMSSTDANATSRFDDITIVWARWTRKPAKPADGGHKPGAGGHNGSGVYVYPSAASTAQAPAHTGRDSSATAGPGAAGTAASGQGTGAGAARSRAVATRPVQGVSQSSVSQIPAPPVESAGAGGPVQVVGVRVREDEHLATGVPFEPSAGVELAADGGASPGQADGGSGVPVLLVSAMAGTLAVLLFGPWLFTAAWLRGLTGFSSRRARSGGPFGRVAR